MRTFQRVNLRVALRNPNENWMAAHLAGTGLRWTRQAVWGKRIFDFWCSALGIAVEVDGPEHRPAWDAFRDEQDHRISGILVLRVRNRHEGDAAAVLATLAAGPGSWNARRKALGLRSLGQGHADRYEPPPKPPKPPRRPRVKMAPPAKPPPAKRPPQAVCPTCHKRIRKRRPDGAIRCRCPRP